MRGRGVRISPSRRLILDFLWASKRVPIVAVQRLIRIPRLVEARAGCASRPSWQSMFLKVYGMATAEAPELRRAYVVLPWPHFYEVERPVAAVILERDYRGERSLFGLMLCDPGRRPLTEITDTIAQAKTCPVGELKQFRRILWVNRLPWPLRRAIWWLGLNIGYLRAKFFGTYSITGASELGIESIFILSPQPTTISYGVIGQDGSVHIRLFFDHRVVDAFVVGAALTRVEALLNGAIADEVAALPKRVALATSAALA